MFIYQLSGRILLSLPSVPTAEGCFTDTYFVAFTKHFTPFLTNIKIDVNFYNFLNPGLRTMAQTVRHSVHVWYQIVFHFNRPLCLCDIIMSAWRIYCGNSISFQTLDMNYILLLHDSPIILLHDMQFLILKALSLCKGGHYTTEEWASPYALQNAFLLF